MAFGPWSLSFLLFLVPVTVFGRPDAARVASLPGHAEEDDGSHREDAGDDKETRAQFPRVLLMLAVETFGFRALLPLFTL